MKITLIAAHRLPSHSGTGTTILYAIKSLHAATGLGLRESKAIVDRLLDGGAPVAVDLIVAHPSMVERFNECFDWQAQAAPAPAPLTLVVAKLAVKAAAQGLTPAALRAAADLMEEADL